MNTLYNKRIILGICGSIAAYKSAELTRGLRKLGADVSIVMTHSATKFITPLTLQALSGKPVHTELMDAEAEAAMGHIALARWADLILIAPASADFIARLSSGRTNDLLSAVCLASKAPLAIAPAMNQAMWHHAATQDNINILTQRDAIMLGPDDGSQACGDVGPGRMLDPEALIASCQTFFKTGLLSGKRVLITAGPTREPIDPVRYISNRSSGKMGFAIAEAAAAAGAEVTLISGPVQQATPDRVKRLDVETANEMHQLAMEQSAACDIFIATAAVADYRPGLQSVHKIKKQSDELHLKLVRTHDILASIAALPGAPFTVGFAAETDHLLDYARTKMASKKLDMIVANPVGPTMGFDQDDNTLDILWAGGHIHYEQSSKKVLATKLIKIIAERINANDTIKNTGRKTR